MNNGGYGKNTLGEVNEKVKERFVKNKHILSFDRFFALFLENPLRFTRSAYQYITDMIDHYGLSSEKETRGKKPGFAVFDRPMNGGKHAVRGQEEVEREIYRILKGFERGGRADKLILLHGPNGSAKSSIARCLMLGLEAYSHTDEGALYRFNWIFPEERFTREGIGFSKEDAPAVDAGDSYAYLPESRIAARITCPLRDNPIFLVPRGERERIYAELRKKDKGFRRRELSEAVSEGDLSPRNRQIFDSLLSAAAGDYARVLQYIQVERYYISERYKVGAATIEAQMSVDAHIQQLTSDRSLASLPPVLQSLNLYEPSGHLIYGNHGIVEYSDLLKRPMDAYKYLLTTCEAGTVNLDVALVHLDLVMLGSTNDIYLESFKKSPDFTSFKARMEFVRVPYLRDFRAERLIYDEQLKLDTGGAVLAPHLTEITALWAVLTRIRKPVAENYPEPVRQAVEKLNPYEKALFYADGVTPPWVTLAQAKLLKSVRGRMLKEFSAGPLYEGIYGASPREGKMILQNAVQSGRGGVVTGEQVLGQIKRLVSDTSVYEWLTVQPEEYYGDQAKLIEYVRRHYVRKVDMELKVAMEMIEETQYTALLERYVAQASAFLQKQRVVDKTSGAERDVDLDFLKEVENIIGPSEKSVAVRQDIVSRLGAYALDNPDEKVEYEILFSKEIEKLERHYFDRQRERVAGLNEDLLLYMTEGPKELGPEKASLVAGVLERMEKRFGYAPECTREVVAMLIKTYYAEK